MASEAPMVNGDLSSDAQCTPVQRQVTPEETVEQMKLLIKENTELKEVLQQNNSAMKQKFEQLTTWKERQNGVIEFLERKLEEAKQTISALTRENKELQKGSERRIPDEAGRAEVATLNTVNALQEAAQVEKLSRELQKAHSDLETAQGTIKTLTDRCRSMEQAGVTLQNQLQEKQQLAQQLQNVQLHRGAEQKTTEELRKSLAELKEAYTQLSDENRRLEEEVRQWEVSREEVSALQTRLEAAEKALVDKQEKIDEMKQEFFRKEKELETISVLQLQADVYSADFHAERAAREKIHEEKERLAAELEFVKQQNRRLQEDLETVARQSLTEMQRRHHSLPGGSLDVQQEARGAVSIQEHTCPKCNEPLPDIDSLQIHIMDCID